MKVRTTLRAVGLAALTPLLEKNVTKTFALDVPAVFSMSRLIVLAFAAGMLRQLWSVGIAGWPESTLAIAIVLALPILGALDRATPEQVVEVTKTLVARFGIGETRDRVEEGCRPERSEGLPSSEAKGPAPSETEPSKYDDHRDDT